MVSIKRPPYYKITVIQLVLLLCAVAVVWIVDITLAISVLSGGLIAVATHLLFAVYAFRYRGVSSSPQILQGFYRGETGKFILTMVGFGCVFAGSEEVRAGGVFAGYIGMLILQLLVTPRVIR